MAKILMFYFFLSIWTLHTEATVLLPCSASNSSNCTSPQEECSSSHSVCLCTQDYFEDPTSHSCTSMTELRVLGINVEKRYTNGVRLSWTADKHGTNVRYDFRANLVGGTYSSSRFRATEYSPTFTLHIIYPSSQYNVTATSVLPANTYYGEKITSTSISGVWTLPHMPGSVTNTEFVNWQADVYDITFGSSYRSASYYTFNISGKGEVRSTGSSPQVRFSNLSPATTYSYTIYAYNGNGDQSPPRSSSFTTPPVPIGVVPRAYVDDVVYKEVEVMWWRHIENITSYSMFITDGTTCVHGFVVKCSDCSTTAQDSTSHCETSGSLSLRSASLNSDNAGFSDQVLGLNPSYNYAATITAWNSDGPGIPYEVVFRTAAADKVSNVSVTSITNQGAQITWRKPTEHKGDITGYWVFVYDRITRVYGLIITCSDCSTGDYDSTILCKKLDCQSKTSAELNGTGTVNVNITGLKLYHNYMAKVEARSSAGVGIRCQIVFRTAAAAADRVSNVSVTSITYHGAQITWRKPTEHKGDITGYSVFIEDGTTCVYGHVITCSDCSTNDHDSTSHCQMSDSESKTTAVLNGTSTISVNVNGLQSYHNYTATITAWGSGEAGISYGIAFRTSAAAAGPVSNVSVSSITYQGAHITWRKPTEYTGVIEGYAVCISDGTTCVYVLAMTCSDCSTSDHDGTSRCRASDSESKTFAVLNGTCTSTISVSITGLKAYHNYTATIGAWSTDGNGILYEIAFKTAAAVAGPVSNVSVVGVTSQGAEVRWRKSAEPKGNITGFSVFISEGTTYCVFGYVITCSDCSTTVHDSISHCKTSGRSSDTFANLNNMGSIGLMVRQLKPHHAYIATITARSFDRAGIPYMISFRTAAVVAVSDVSVTSITYQGAHVTWRKSTEHKGDITGYSVFIKDGTTCVYGHVITCSDCSTSDNDSTSHCQMSDTESMTSSVLNSTSTISVSMTGLKPYHNFTASITARSSDGTGTPFELAFRTAAAVPETVKNITVTSSRDVLKNWINLDVIWTPGEFTGPTDYIVVVQEETRLNSGSYRPLPSQIVGGYSTTQVTVTNVLAYWRYRVSVTTKTTVGISDSYNSQPIQTESSVPGVVKSIVIQQDDVTAEAMTMTITCPDEKDRNGTVKEFSIKKYLLNSDKFVVRSHEYRINLPLYSSSSCGITVSEIDVGGIVVGQWYSFAVKVINEDFEGSYYNTGEYFFVAPRQHKDDDDITLVITIAVAGAVVVVLVIIITILIVLYRRKGVRHKKKRKLNTYNTPGLDGPGSERHNYEGMEMSRTASRAAAAAAAARPTHANTESNRLYGNIPREDRSDHESRNVYTVVEDNDYMTQWHYGNIQNAHLAHGQGSSSQSLGHTDFGVYETLDQSTTYATN